MTALERARAALEQREQSKGARADLIAEDLGLGLRVSPFTWAEARESVDDIAEKTGVRDMLDVAAVHVAGHVEEVFGLGDDGEPSPLLDGGRAAVLDEELADLFGVSPFVSSAHLLVQLFGEVYVENAWQALCAPHGGKVLVRLGEAPAAP